MFSLWNRRAIPSVVRITHQLNRPTYHHSRRHIQTLQESIQDIATHLLKGVKAPRTTISSNNSCDNDDMIQYHVWDHFLESMNQKPLMDALTNRVREMDANNELKFVLNQVAFRTDRVKWIEKNNSSASGSCFDEYMAIMTQLQHELFEAMNQIQSQQELQISEMHEMKKMEVMVSCYPSNSAHYDRHIDDARGVFDRIITCVYYVSDHVSDQEIEEGNLGGHLRLFPSTVVSGDSHHVDVAPVKDRLVLFSSRDTPHEVRPTFHKRYAVSMWLYGKQPLLPAQLERIQRRELSS